MNVCALMSKILMGASLLLVLSGPAHGHAGKCKEVSTAVDFDLQSYVSRPWYVHQQAVTIYVPESRLNCVRAEYREFKGKTWPWKYTVEVNNEAQNSDGEIFGGRLCAYNEDKNDPAKLAVAPCWLPKAFAGSYWVIAYNETEGYALVSGGQPKFPTKDGLCRTGRLINESGLWIFLRQKEQDARSEALVAEVREIALQQGFDLSVLKNVTQNGCEYDGDRRFLEQGFLRGSGQK